MENVRKNIATALDSEEAAGKLAPMIYDMMEAASKLDIAFACVYTTGDHTVYTTRLPKSLPVLACANNVIDLDFDRLSNMEPGEMINKMAQIHMLLRTWGDWMATSISAYHKVMEEIDEALEPNPNKYDA